MDGNNNWVWIEEPDDSEDAFLDVIDGPMTGPGSSNFTAWATDSPSGGESDQCAITNYQTVGAALWGDEDCDTNQVKLGC